MRSSIETKILAGFGFAIIVIVAIGIATYRNAERLVQTRDLVPRTQKTENALKDVLTVMTDAETGQRGFVITNDPAFLEPMDRAKQRLEPALAGLKELLGNNPLQSSSFDALQEASRSRMAAIVEMVALRSNYGFDAAQERIATGAGRGATDRIRQLIARMESVEAELLVKQNAEAQMRNEQMTITVIAGGLLSFGVLGLMWRLTSLDMKARRKAEAALRSSEEFKTQILESGGDSIVVLGLAGQTIFMNKHAQDALSGSSVVGRGSGQWIDTWPEQSREVAVVALNTARKGGRGRFRALHTTAAEEPKWWDVQVTPILGSTGEPEKLLVVCRDITEARVAEKKFRALFEHSADAHLIYDEKGVLDCNRAAVQMLGFSHKDEVRARRFIDLAADYQPDGAASVERSEEWQKLAQERGEMRGEWQLRRADGTEFPVEISLTAVPLGGRSVILVVWRDLADRKLAEAALRESEERFQAFMNHSPTIAFIKDAEGRYLYVNRQFEEQFGVDFENDLVGHTDSVWLPEQTVELIAATDRQVLETGKPTSLLEVVPLANGHIAEWLVLKFPMSTTDGQQLVGGVGIDISKQKRAERVLREREAEFRDLFDEAPVAYHELDTADRFTRVNATELAMLGYSAEEMVGCSISDFIIDEPLSASSRAPAGNLQTLEMAQRTFRKKDGSTVPVLMRHKLIQDPYGQLRGMRSTLQDISALKRTEQELRDAEEKYRSIFENAIEGIFQSTPAGIFRSVNPALAALYGYVSPEEMIRAVTDISVQLYLDPDRRTEFVRRLDEHGELTDFESEVTRRDGTTLWISERARVVRDASGAVAYYEGTVEDVTAKRQAEGAMTSARDSALESVRLKSEFLANMSHEIRTPMNGIIGMTGLLLDTELSHKQRDFTQTISNSADALLTIINDILDFSKIEAGMLNFEELDFQLGSVVEGAVDLLAERALSKNLELASLVYSDVPVALCGDPGRLRQVLTNLIGNAIKFTDSGEVTVKAKKVEETDEDALLRFSIVDSGIGITPDQQKRLFQAFIQADGSTTRRYGGTGLGLAICKQLVEQMRGEIGVTSTAGKGSTFWFTARFQKQRHAIAFVGPERSQLRGVRALIVDDNDTNRKILHHLFQAWGVHDAQASSGAEALALLDEAASGNEPFDLAVLDMQMPEMDGGMLARKVKADPRFAAIRLVMMTSLDRSEDPIAMREAGFEAYLTKPVKQSPLFDCLVTVMARNSQPRNVLPVLLPKPEATPGGGHAACGRALQILIVEDNIVNQKVALHQLQKLGHLADAADNGQLALDALRRAPYDLIFMDCQMPELDGYEATRELRRIEGESRHTWVVAMTAHSLTGDRDKCLAAGMDDYLSKPVKSEDLAAALARFQGVSQADCDSDERNSETRTTIDRNLLNGFRDLDQDGGDSILGKLIDLFLENTPVVLKDAHSALATQASPQLARAAHSLKGSCSNFGAERMRQLCSDLEQQAHGGDFDRSAELLGRIEKEFRHVRMALERERPSRVA